MNRKKNYVKPECSVIPMPAANLMLSVSGGCTTPGESDAKESEFRFDSEDDGTEEFQHAPYFDVWEH